VTAIVVVWNQKDTDMPQSVFSGIDQPAVIPATGGEPQATGRGKPGRYALDEHLTLGEYVTPEQLAQHLGKSTRTLARWHSQRIGPPRCAVGKLILYRLDAVRDWLAGRETAPPQTGTRRSLGGRRQ
jgi:hypothetical protein